MDCFIKKGINDLNTYLKTKADWTKTFGMKIFSNVSVVILESTDSKSSIHAGRIHIV